MEQEGREREEVWSIVERFVWNDECRSQRALKHFHFHATPLLCSKTIYSRKSTLQNMRQQIFLPVPWIVIDFSLARIEDMRYPERTKNLKNWLLQTSDTKNSIIFGFFCYVCFQFVFDLLSYIFSFDMVLLKLVEVNLTHQLQWNPQETVALWDEMRVRKQLPNLNKE